MGSPKGAGRGTDGEKEKPEGGGAKRGRLYGDELELGSELDDCKEGRDGNRFVVLGRGGKESWGVAKLGKRPCSAGVSSTSFTGLCASDSVVFEDRGKTGRTTQSSP